jgi:Flp pilus assembly protein TadG
MLPPLIPRPRRRTVNRSQERGVTLILVALAIFSIVAMAGLSIDVGTLYQASAEAQRAADAGALAAARAISMSGITGAPTTDVSSWQKICGGTSSVATSTAIAVAQQNYVGGTPVPSGGISVTYSAASAALSSGSSDCSTLTGGFGVNPVVTVKVTQSSLPTFFSRVWGRTGNSVSATASAEALNPSNSSTYSSNSDVVPVQPRCVKPWLVPNYEPWSPGTTCTTNCTHFIDQSSGVIETQGILAAGSGVIGQTFWLVPNCHNGPTCTLRSPNPQANYGTGATGPPNLEYLPGQASFASTAIPTAGSDACSSVSGNYAEAIAGCDQSTQYQCGKVGQNVVDLNENPRHGDTSNGAQCLIHQGTTGSDTVSSLGQDLLLPFPTAPPSAPTYPFQIQAGTSNPLTAARGSLVTSSTSIVSLPIYDSNAVTNFPAGNTSVTVIGFLQVFINYVDGNGNLNVTVMNVAGCGNSASGTALTGTSPLPVRLITTP